MPADKRAHLIDWQTVFTETDKKTVRLGRHPHVDEIGVRPDARFDVLLCLNPNQIEDFAQFHKGQDGDGFPLSDHTTPLDRVRLCVDFGCTYVTKFFVYSLSTRHRRETDTVIGCSSSSRVHERMVPRSPILGI